MDNYVRIPHNLLFKKNVNPGIKRKIYRELLGITQPSADELRSYNTPRSGIGMFEHLFKVVNPERFLLFSISTGITCGPSNTPRGLHWHAEYLYFTDLSNVIIGYLLNHTVKLEGINLADRLAIK